MNTKDTQEWPLTPITDETFNNQNWERYDETEITKSGKKEIYYCSCYKKCVSL